MSDYLMRLATRMTSPIPAVLPRARARFDAASDSSPIEETDLLTESPERPRGGITSVARKAEPRLPQGHAPVAPARQDTAELPGPTLRYGETRYLLATERPRDDTTLIAGPPTEVPSPERRILIAKEPKAAGEAPPVRAEPASPYRVSVAGAPASASAIPTSIATPLIRAGAAPHPMLAHQEHTDVRNESTLADRTQNLPEAVSEETIVEISIGRIEVQAPPAPLPASSKMRRQPRLTLETYLQRRGGGR